MDARFFLRVCAIRISSKVHERSGQFIRLFGGNSDEGYRLDCASGKQLD